MIGGAMLSCAVLAMIVIAAWSLARDDRSEDRSQDGLLALRRWGRQEGSEALGEGKRRSKGGATRRSASMKTRSIKTGPRKDGPRRRHAAERGMTFNRDEMNRIAEEVAEGPPITPRRRRP